MKGREVQTEAIVLRSVTSGEDDLLVEFLTPGEGRLTGIARHGRKSQKRFGTVLVPLNVVRLRYQDSGGIVSLREASLEGSPHRLDLDLPLLLWGFYLLDLVREWVPERSPEPKLYLLLSETLGHLNQRESLPQIIQEFEYRFLELVGLRPNLTQCLSCHKPWDLQGRFFFVFREGGIFCASCLPRGTPFEPFSKRHLPRVLARFIEYQLGHPLRSRTCLTHKFLTEAAFLG